MIKPKNGRRGQALLMVTLALFAMGGLMGLAVDLGWSYFVKKSAQGATDAAALAVAYQALANVGQSAAFPSTYHHSLAACPETGVTALSNGCQYAQAEKYGFSHNGHNNHQDVTMESGVNSTPNDCSNSPTPSTAPCITADFWVTVRAVETIPQLFSALLGNTTGIASARSTAAVVPVIVNGSLITLNRANDGQSNISLAGHGEIIAGQGIIVANNDANNGISTNGNTSFTGPVSQLVGNPAGTTPRACSNNPGGCTFETAPDGTKFLDPMRGLGQPPLPSSALPTYAVVGGDLSSSPIYKLVGSTNATDQSTNYSGTQLPQGNYVSAAWASGCGIGRCTSVNLGGTVLNVGNTATFANGGFGTFIFYGGLMIPSGNTMTMGPGEYVVVGGLTFDGVLQPLHAVANGLPATDAGEMIVLTGTSGTVGGTVGSLTNTAANNLYPGLVTQLNSNQMLGSMATAGTRLAFSQTEFFKSSDGTGQLNGINPDGSGFPSSGTMVNPVGTDLSKFAGVVFWQDQADSSVKYTSNGNIDTSCGSINSPCTTSYPTAAEINFHAQGTATLQGIFYQPRGAGIKSIGHGNSGDISGNLMMITGYFDSNGGGGLDLDPTPIPLKRRIAALIE